MRVENNRIYFRNCEPSKYDSLGEIDWVAPLWCEECGHIEKEEVSCCPNYHDGYTYENPICRKCGKALLGLPVKDSEKIIVVKRRRKMTQS